MERVKLEIEDSEIQGVKIERFEESDYINCSSIKQETDCNLNLNKNSVLSLESGSPFEDNVEDCKHFIENSDWNIKIVEQVDEIIHHGNMESNEGETGNNKHYVTSTLKQHMMNGQFKGEKLKCQLCRYVTEDSTQLKAHLKTFHHQFEFKCHICDFSSPLEFCLKRHVTIEHPENLEFKCLQCDYSTSKKHHLQSHENAVHSKAKVFKCDMCDYSSHYNQCIKTHMDSVHLRLKKFKCQFCDYAANKNHHLKSHVSSVHMQKRDFKCQYCDYSTNRKHVFDDHLNSLHLRTKIFQCDLCEYNSTRKHRLKMHVNRMHSLNSKV